MVLGNPDALTQVLWAEDGLFALCVRSLDPVSCTIEPFAGYLLLMPRLSTALVSLLPITAWPLASVMLALFITGVLSSSIYVALRGFGLSIIGSGASALVFILMPLSGLEVIGVIGSLSSPLLIASAVVVIAVPRSGVSHAGVSFLLLVTALTMPAAVVLAPFIVLNWFWRRITSHVAYLWFIALSVGLVLQAFVVLTAEDSRNMSISITSVSDWARGMVASILTVVPGLELGEISLTPFTTLRPSPYLAWLVVVFLIALALFVIIRGRVGQSGDQVRPSVAAQLVLVALVTALVPCVSGTFSFRYFVAPLALLLISLIVLIDARVGQLASWKVALGVLLLVFLWYPSFSASELRSSPAPA